MELIEAYSELAGRYRWPSTTLAELVCWRSATAYDGGGSASAVVVPGGRGSLAGWLAGLVSGAVHRLFFSSRGLEAAGLQEGVGEHRHQGMSM